MTTPTATTEATDLRTAWEAWHAGREAELSLPHGWLSLTALHWLDAEARPFGDLPGTWLALPGAAGVELTAAAADGVVVDGQVVDGTVTLEPVDGLPGVLVEIGERRVEVIRRTDGHALRVRDPLAITRTAFAGAPAFPPAPRWVVTGRFEAYPQPRRLTVGAVVEGLQHFPTAVGVVRFALDGTGQELLAFPGRSGGGLMLHFRDATSGEATYGGGRALLLPEPDPDGRVELDFNRTLNLPCAFTAHATCPLPPAENRLPVAIEAGETTPGRPDLAG